VFSFKPHEKIPALETGESFTLKIAFGTTKAILPLGYIYNDLDLATGFTKVVPEFNSGVLSIKYLNMSMGRNYTVSVKVAFTDANPLSSSKELGFGMISLEYRGKIIIQSQSVFNSGFNSL